MSVLLLREVPNTQRAFQTLLVDHIRTSPPQRLLPSTSLLCFKQRDPTSSRRGCIVFWTVQLLLLLLLQTPVQTLSAVSSRAPVDAKRRRHPKSAAKGKAELVRTRKAWDGPDTGSAQTPAGSHAPRRGVHTGSTTMLEPVRFGLPCPNTPGPKIGS